MSGISIFQMIIASYSILQYNYYQTLVCVQPPSSSFSLHARYCWTTTRTSKKESSDSTSCYCSSKKYARFLIALLQVAREVASSATKFWVSPWSEVHKGYIHHQWNVWSTPAQVQPPLESCMNDLLASRLNLLHLTLYSSPPWPSSIKFPLPPITGHYSIVSSLIQQDAT